MSPRSPAGERVAHVGSVRPVRSRDGADGRGAATASLHTSRAARGASRRGVLGAHALRGAVDLTFAQVSSSFACLSP